MACAQQRREPLRPGWLGAAPGQLWQQDTGGCSLSPAQGFVMDVLPGAGTVTWQ